MPLYEYECDACGLRFERIRKFSDPPLTECPSCAGRVRKLLSSPAIQFKGSGFYITDYARTGRSEDAEKTDKADKADKTDKTDKAATPGKTDKTSASSTDGGDAKTGGRKGDTSGAPTSRGKDAGSGSAPKRNGGSTPTS